MYAHFPREGVWDQKKFFLIAQKRICLLGGVYSGKCSAWVLWIDPAGSWHMLVVWFQARHLSSLSLSFFIYKMEIIKHPTLWDCWKFREGIYRPSTALDALESACEALVILIITWVLQNRMADLGERRVTYTRCFGNWTGEGEMKSNKFRDRLNVPQPQCYRGWFRKILLLYKPINSVSSLEFLRIRFSLMFPNPGYGTSQPGWVQNHLHSHSHLLGLEELGTQPP